MSESEPFGTVSSRSSLSLNPSSSSSSIATRTRTRIRCSEAHPLPSCHKRHYLAEGEVAPYEKYWIPKFAPKDKAQLDENGQPLPIGFRVTNRPRTVDSAPKTWWCGVYCRKFHDISQIPFGKCPQRTKQ